MLLRGNRGRISRYQQSIKGGLQRIDSQWEGTYPLLCYARLCTSLRIQLIISLLFSTVINRRLYSLKCSNEILITKGESFIAQ